MEVAAQTGANVPDKTSFPAWWHLRGSKMTLVRQTADELVIGSKAAEIKLRRRDASSWFVNWEIRMSQIEKVKGCVIMGIERLRQAFGLDAVVRPDELARQLDADVVSRGQYIRRGDFLNIPCPGTGHDGDPNLSLELDDRMRAAVRQLIG